MTDKDKTKEQLVDELMELRQRNAELEASEAKFRETEEALRESKAELLAIYDNAPVVMLLVDRDRRVHGANYTAVKLSGRAIEEIKGRRGGEALGCIHADDDPRGCGFGRTCRGCQVRQTVVNTFETGENYYQTEARVQLVSRQEGMDLLVSTVLIDLAAGERVLVCLEDITERKRMEEELLKIQKLESVGVLAGGIAHDLNNLLTGVIGNISLARLYDDLENKDRRLAEAEGASMQIRDLTHQLLTFSKGGAPIRQTAVIGDLLEASATFALRGANVRCEFSVPDDLWPAEVDEGQINQVINNLVINSQQAMPEGGVITISAENMTIGAESGLLLEPGAYIKVSVEDQGVGIPEEHLQRIFDPFFTTKQAGSGLGLATSYSIIQKHNGHITVESRMGVGTTFHIYLPASPGGVLMTKEEEKETLIMGEGTILVIDDEQHIRDLASDILDSIGYKVTTAVDGAEAVKMYRRAMESGNPFDAVVVDLTIPGGMGGRETIQRLIKIDPEVKAIVSSGYSNDPIMADFREYGFRDVIVKPYKPRELSEVLHRIITE